MVGCDQHKQRTGSSSARTATMSTTTRLYTIDDLMAMPTDQPWELWEGELQRVPGAGGEASDIASEMLIRVRPFVKSRNLGLAIGADGTYVLNPDGPTVVVPDMEF